MYNIIVFQYNLQENIEISNRALKFVQTLRSFYEVVKSCFGQEVQPSFKADIKKFTDDYISLDISITPKVNLKISNVKS